MIKVLIVSTIGFGLYGITNSIMNYYREMDKSDMQIDFLSPSEVPENMKEEIKNNGGTIYENITRNDNPMKYMIKLAVILSIGQYDIVHAHGNSNTLGLEMTAAKLCKVKVRIAHCHNSTCNHKVFNKVLKPLLKNSYTHAFACSKKAGKWLFGKNSYTVIHNGIPISKYIYNEEVRNDVRMKLNFENNFVVGHVGHFSYQKNHEFLINIFNELYKKDSSCRLLLIGDGDLRESLEKQVKELGLEKVVCIYGETQEITNLLQAMDVFVFPSRFEGLGIAAIEAQSVGLPCVVSSAVPREAKILKHFDFVHLNTAIEIWANKILKYRNFDRVEYIKEYNQVIKNSHYNIENEACKLRKLYIEYVKK